MEQRDLPPGTAGLHMYWNKMEWRIKRKMRWSDFNHDSCPAGPRWIHKAGRRLRWVVGKDGSFLSAIAMAFISSPPLLPQQSQNICCNFPSAQLCSSLSGSTVLLLPLSQTTQGVQPTANVLAYVPHMLPALEMPGYLLFFKYVPRSFTV